MPRGWAGKPKPGAALGKQRLPRRHSTQASRLPYPQAEGLRSSKPRPKWELHSDRPRAVGAIRESPLQSGMLLCLQKYITVRFLPGKCSFHPGLASGKATSATSATVDGAFCSEAISPASTDYLHCKHPRPSHQPIPSDETAECVTHRSQPQPAPWKNQPVSPVWTSFEVWRCWVSC